jgi:hypothetical protein
MNFILRAFAPCALLLCLATVALADLKVKQKTTTGGQTYESTVMIKGQRERRESNFGGAGGGTSQVSLLQCDLRRTLTINDNTRRYLIYPFDGGDATDGATPAPAPATASAPARRGGTVVYTTTITDTGERREMFGLTARHLKTKLTIEPAPDACNPDRFHQETDGWYTDFEYGLSCETGMAAARQRPVQTGGCQDRVVTKQLGTARLGFPLSLTTTTYGPDGRVTSTSTSEVSELSRTPLDAALFDVPAGYTVAHNTQELYGLSVGDVAGTLMGGQTNAGGNEPGATTNTTTASAAPAAKSPGAIRVGVAQVKDLTDKNLSTDSARARLISALIAAGLEAVPLDAYTPAALDTEATAKECDFFLTTDIISLKLSAARKIGGLLGRASGVGSAGVDRTEAQLNFKLTPTGASAAQLQSSANAKEEGDDLSLNAALDKEAQTVAKEAKKKK